MKNQLSKMRDDLRKLKNDFGAAAETNWSNRQEKATAVILALKFFIPYQMKKRIWYDTQYFKEVYQRQLKTRIETNTESLQEFGTKMDLTVL